MNGSRPRGQSNCAGAAPARRLRLRGEGFVLHHKNIAQEEERLKKCIDPSQFFIFFTLLLISITNSVFYLFSSTGSQNIRLRARLIPRAMIWGTNVMVLNLNL